jgi:predicted nucleic acid-binding protein
VIYLDSSALVKLIVREPQSAALRRYLAREPERSSCALARVEVVRSVRAHGRRVVARARALLEHLELLRLDDPLLDAAAALDDEGLRSLDAIHIAAASTLGSDLNALVTYDRRMGAAARALGLPVAEPS